MVKKAKTETKSEKVEKGSNDQKNQEKLEKRKARMEALKNRPAGQRPNSKQCDVIEGEGYKVNTYGYGLRDGIGVITTSVLLDEKGKPVGISSAFVPGTRLKSKKGHGTISPAKTNGKEETEE